MFRDRSRIARRSRLAIIRIRISFCAPCMPMSCLSRCYRRYSISCTRLPAELRISLNRCPEYTNPADLPEGYEMPVHPTSGTCSYSCRSVGQDVCPEFGAEPPTDASLSTYAVSSSPEYPHSYDFFWFAGLCDGRWQTMLRIRKDIKAVQHSTGIIDIGTNQSLYRRKPRQRARTALETGIRESAGQSVATVQHPHLAHRQRAQTAGSHFSCRHVPATCP